MIWRQASLTLKPRNRGVHLITEEVLGAMDLSSVRVGLLHLFLQHTSASLSLNENASVEVRQDLEAFFRALVPDGHAAFRHTLEGPDDMPAHIKTSLLGTGLLLPIRDGNPALGTWQGLYLAEHRERAGPRRIVLTRFGSG